MIKRNKTAVIGLGNRLLADEGAGVWAVGLVRERCVGSGVMGVDLVEAGTPGMGLLHHFEEREKIIFIDAGHFGAAPGEYRRFRPEEAVSHKDPGEYSLHGFDLMKFIRFAGRMGMTSGVDIVIYCIQAQETGMSEQLSPAVAGGLPGLVHDVLTELTAGENK